VLYPVPLRDLVMWIAARQLPMFVERLRQFRDLL